MRLQAIYQGAARPGTQALGLTSVYVDLNTDKRIPAKTTPAEARAKEWRPGKPLERQERMQTEGKTRLVPVLEALALHPKMVLLGRPGSGKSILTAFLALSLAEARLGETKLHERLGNEWPHGPLHPVRVVLRRFAASLPVDLVRGCARHLWDFIRQDLVNSALAAGTADALRDAARDEGDLLLFDGLDETRDPHIRARVLEAVADFVANAGTRCRFLLTSRPYAWEETAPVLARQPDPLALNEMFVPYTLADFEPSQMESFIRRWYPAVQARGWVTAADATTKAQELLAAVKRQDLQPLARNPLLLTLMATLHSSRAKLPEDRADLYDEVVKLLLERWNETVGADRGLLLELNIPSLKLEDIRLEIGLAAVNRRPEHSAVRERVVGWLASLLATPVEAGGLPVRELARAGMVLDRLGDPPKGVGLGEDGVPDIDWVTVAAAPFVMGAKKATWDMAEETPQFDCQLVRQAYQLSRYPITVAQYHAFVEAGGYREARYWTKTGWKWRQSVKREMPLDHEEVHQTPNHPRVGVTWYEAVAFCRWLSERLGFEVSLPTKAQWERAARHTDGRTYPWGEAANVSARANVMETGIGSTTAVALFPQGKAECGALDMAGNVWEWCRTIWRLKFWPLTLCHSVLFGVWAEAARARDRPRPLWTRNAARAGNELTCGLVLHSEPGRISPGMPEFSISYSGGPPECRSLSRRVAAA